MKVDLSRYDNNLYVPGPKIILILWYVVSRLFFKGSWVVSSKIKVFWLNLFGACVGVGVVIKPNVNIKYPWKLEIGDYCWIGEGVSIVNLDMVTLKDNVCISQDAMLLCGNHNYKSVEFDLMLGPIYIEEGSWVGARSCIGPGVILGSHSVLCFGSVTFYDLEPYTIYKGNPAQAYKKRIISQL